MTELSKKSRKEVAEYIASEKVDRARIKVEQLIRDDYMVEALEILENFCDAILSRFGLILAQSTVDEGILEMVVTLIWVAPRLSTDVPELNKISDQLMLKYGKRFFDTARSNCLRLASSKVVDCMGLQPPSLVLVDKYLKAIADTYNLAFEPQYIEQPLETSTIELDLLKSYLSSQSNLNSSKQSVENSNDGVVTQTEISNEDFADESISSTEKLPPYGGEKSKCRPPDPDLTPNRFSPSPKGGAAHSSPTTEDTLLTITPQSPHINRTPSEPNLLSFDDFDEKLSQLEISGTRPENSLVEAPPKTSKEGNKDLQDIIFSMKEDDEDLNRRFSNLKFN